MHRNPHPEIPAWAGCTGDPDHDNYVHIDRAWKPATPQDMDIHFILVEPTRPENVGASARAIKTMGFHSLRLVNPCDHLAERAQWLAHGSLDILQNATLYSSLEQALRDIDFAVGTASEKRSVKYDWYRCEDIPALIENKGDAVSNAAIVFGREDTGLLNAELQSCDIVSTIPMKTESPTLNLAQAVMVYAYSVSSLSLKPSPVLPASPEPGEFASLKGKIDRLLRLIDIQPESNIYNRILERAAALEADDIHLLHSVCNAIFRRNP